ncbi:MAG: twin-arginine translocation signal domain-containing protein [Rhizobiales bacterium]|nr:twin-arginine translocation signal domain-containing protein [Hyphomicrobiales bacterium]
MTKHNPTLLNRRHFLQMTALASGTMALTAAGTSQVFAQQAKVVVGTWGGDYARRRPHPEAERHRKRSGSGCRCTAPRQNGGRKALAARHHRYSGLLLRQYVRDERGRGCRKDRLFENSQCRESPAGNEICLRHRPDLFGQGGCL